MLTVTEINYIREQVNLKDETYATVGRKLGIDARTIKKYADMEDFNLHKPHKQTRTARVMDSVKPVIDKWLIEDFKKKKKYRRTAKRIHQLLLEQHEFTGSDRTIRDYVSKRKKELLNTVQSSAIPLTAKPGMAQIDFGEAPFYYQNTYTTLSYLVLSFPYSNAFWFQVLEAQNKEAFLEGMKRIFHHMGGVPKAIRFDNLSPAVKKIRPHGKRDLTEEFERFTAHYGFQLEFCNPARGNEKGHVEAMVKYVRNNFLLPEVHTHNLKSLNQDCWLLAENDRGRIHYQKQLPISELYSADKEAFLLLPEKEFDCIRYEEVKADKYGYVHFDTNLYSSSPRFALEKVLLKISYEYITVFSLDYKEIVQHHRLYGYKEKSMDWQPYLSLVSKRPTALKYTSFYDQLPDAWQSYFSQCTVEEKKDSLQLLSTILKDNHMEIAVQALLQASENSHPSAESIKQIFYQLVNGRGVRVIAHLPQHTPSMPTITRGLGQYDKLFKPMEYEDHA